MFAPVTRSMTFTLGLCTVALCPDLLAETGSDQEPGSALVFNAHLTESADNWPSTLHWIRDERHPTFLMGGTP
jgi:hypothetical protein